MKKRRFAGGGETDPELESGVRSGPNPNIDDDTRQRAAEYVGGTSKPAVSASAFPAVARRGSDTEEAPAKRKIVTKEELEKSGLSLRDYMNKQQGLTRRSTPSSRGPAAPAMASTPAPTREQLIAQIPTGGSGAGPTPSAGNSASGSELGRNIKNTLSALSGYQGVNLAKAAAEGATARAAAARAASARAEAAKKAEMAGELRRGAQPTKFTSPSKSTAAKRTRKFNEDEANTEFKRGGSVQKYAKGGSVSSRADGIAQRGKTRGKMC